MNFDLSDAKLVATTRYLTQRMGMSMDDWSLAYTRMASTVSASGVDGLDRIYQRFIYWSSWASLTPGMPGLAPLLKKNTEYAGEVPGRVGVDFTGTPAQKAELCQTLKGRSLQAFASAGASCPATNGHPLPPPTVQMLNRTRSRGQTLAGQAQYG